MFERFTSSAREAVVGAQGEARALGHRRIDTEHLLLGLLHGRDDIAARVLREAGIEAEQVRAQIDRLAGILGPLGASDAEALSSIGIDLDAVRTRIEETFGPGALEEPLPARRRRWPLRDRESEWDSRHIPFSPRAKKVMELALREAVRLRHRYIGSEHLLLGLLRDGDGLAARILADAGLTVAGLREQVYTAMGEAA
jgi:ATP-dependent Clp protease ATP-binding subunit ClpA